MPNINNKLKRASYRGVRFFYVSTQRSLGFKSVTHEYPNSDNAINKQQGLKARTLSVTAQVEYGNDRAFDIALNTPGNGILVHPIDGPMIVKVDSEYTKSDSINELGMFEYQVRFFIEVGLSVPTIEGITVATISRLRSAALDKVVPYVRSRINVGF